MFKRIGSPEGPLEPIKFICRGCNKKVAFIKEGVCEECDVIVKKALLKIKKIGK